MVARTLIHMLALPAQLRNNLWRSFFEKNRSSTVMFNPMFVQ